MQGKEGKGMRKEGDRPVCWRWRVYGGGRSSRRCSSRSRRGVGVDIGVSAVLGAKTSMIREKASRLTFGVKGFQK
jgi:hypothetical protein